MEVKSIFQWKIAWYYLIECMTITYSFWSTETTDKIDFTSSFICFPMSSLKLLNCWWVNASWLCQFRISHCWVKEHLDHMTKHSSTPLQVPFLWDWEYLAMFSNKLKTNFMYENYVSIYIFLDLLILCNIL